MDTLNLKFRLLLLLVTVGTVLGSCAYDDDEKMYSSRSYDEAYALLRPYIIVNEYDEFELSATKEVTDPLRIYPGHIARLKGDLHSINLQTKKALNDYQCSQVLMVTERQGVLVKKTAFNLAYEIGSNDPGLIATRADASMVIDSEEGGSASFTGGTQVRTDISISPGRNSPYVLTFDCSTGKLSNDQDYIYWVGTVGATLTNWWHANNPNGNNTQWSFSANGLSNGARGYVSFQSR